MNLQVAILMFWLCCVLVRNGMEVTASQNVMDSSHESMSEKQPYRTSFHFQTPKNWLNDPNGPMYYNGVYHLFYQYNPYGPVFGDKMVWAHSVSYDLVNWIILKNALEPSEPYDINSCWSGSTTILQGNKPVIFYTGIDSNHRQVQNLAFPRNLSNPFLEEWIKYENNPVIDLPEGVRPDNFRDPTTAWQGPDDKWKVIVGSFKDEQGMAFLYESDDFFQWKRYEHPFYASIKTGMWECPDFYPVPINSTNGVDTSTQNASVKHVMKTSFNSHDYYILGTYDSKEEKFIPDIDFTGTTLDLRHDYGKFYASKTFFDGRKNRRILFSWVNESDSTEDDIRKGWSGLQSIPRQVWLDRNGKQLIHWPVEEINTLRDKQISINSLTLERGAVMEVPGITAAQADVEVFFELPKLEETEHLDHNWLDPQLLCSSKDALQHGKHGPFGLLALATKDLTEQTAIYFQIFRRQNRYAILICSDQSRSSLKKDVDKTTYGAFLDLDPTVENISLRSLMDHSIIESFADEGRVCITTRVYPTLALDEAAHLYAFNNGTANVKISKLNAWSMKKALIVNKDAFGLIEDHILKEEGAYTRTSW